jgi:threonine/homoserine/homoserine lactone efflux protein
MNTMPDASSILLFLAATLTLNLTPGPDMLYVVARSVGQGRAAGVASALGISLGCVCHMLAVAFGLSGLMLAIPTAYDVVKYAGAAYLVYLGVRVLVSRQTFAIDDTVKPDTMRSVFLQGVITNLLNPKVALFFLAFLPQFVDKTQGNIAAQIILLGVLFNISGTTVNVVVAVVASFAGQRFKARLRDSRMLRWLSGGIFIGLGVRLALLERK